MLKAVVAALALTACCTASIVSSDPSPVKCVSQLNCTGELQAALDDHSHPVVYLASPSSGEPYVTKPLFLRRDNVKIVCRPGTMLLAMRNEFHGLGDSLLTMEEVTNVTLSNCHFRMWREDYANSSIYKHAEWRMALNLRSVTNLLVEETTLEESGGDGIYFGDSGHGPNRNVVVTNSVLRNHYRNGISIITAMDVLVKDTLITGTKGTPPECGVDVEPNLPSEFASNVTFKRVSFTDSHNCGIVVTTYALKVENTPYTISFDDCVVDGAGSYGVLVNIPYAHSIPADVPQLTMSNLNVRNTASYGVFFLTNNVSASRATVMQNVMLSNCSYSEHSSVANIAVDFRRSWNVQLKAPFVIENTNDRLAVYEQGPVKTGISYNVTGVFSNITAGSRRGCEVGGVGSINGVNWTVEECNAP